jgi:Na+-driven multidrug efflux pump
VSAASAPSPAGWRRWLPSGGDRLGAWQAFQALRYLGPLAIGVAFAKGPLSRADIGAWESLFLLSGLTGFFWVGGLLSSLVPRFRRSGEDQRRALLAGSFWSAMACNALLVALLWWGRDAVGGWLGRGPLPHYGLFLVFMAFNNPAFLAEYVYLLDERPRALWGYGLATLAGLLAAVLVPVFAGYGLQGAVAGLAAHAFLRWTWLLGLLHRRLGTELWRRPPAEVWRAHLRVALPLSGSLLLGGAAAYGDGLIVVNRLDAEALAVFQYGARELPMVFLLANAFSVAAAADVAARREDGLALIRSRSSAWMLRFLPISVALMLTSRWWYPLVFSPAFAESHAVFNIYLLLMIPRLMFPQTVLTGLERNRPQLGASAAELALNVGLSLLLVERFGLVGVAWATVLAHLADKLLLVAWLRRAHGLRPKAYLDVGRAVAVSAALGLAYAASLWLDARA